MLEHGQSVAGRPGDFRSNSRRAVLKTLDGDECDRVGDIYDCLSTPRCGDGLVGFTLSHRELFSMPLGLVRVAMNEHPFWFTKRGLRRRRGRGAWVHGDPGFRLVRRAWGAESEAPIAAVYGRRMFVAALDQFL